MAKVIPMPPAKRHFLVVLFNRGPETSYRLELVDADSGGCVGAASDLVLYDLVTKMRSLSCAPEKISSAIDSMLAGQQSMLFGIDLTDGQVADFRRRQS